MGRRHHRQPPAEPCDATSPALGTAQAIAVNWADRRAPGEPRPPVRADADPTSSARRPARYSREVCPHAVDLLRRAQAGQSDAFAGLYLIFREPVTRYVAARMRHIDRDAVPDLVHDAFCDALASLSSADPDVRGWLIRLAAKACTRYDWSRRRYIRAFFAVRDAQLRMAGVDGPDHLPDVPAGVGRVSVVHALSRLVPGQRRAVQLRFLDGVPRDLAAQVLDRTPEAVRMLERRALRRLHAEVTDAGFTHPGAGTGYRARTAGAVDGARP